MSDGDGAEVSIGREEGRGSEVQVAPSARGKGGEARRATGAVGALSARTRRRLGSRREPVLTPLSEL